MFVFQQDAAYLFKQGFRHDRREDICTDFASVFKNTDILFHTEHIVERVQSERSAVIGNAFGLQLRNQFPSENALRILLKNGTHNFRFLFIDIDALVLYPIAERYNAAGV